MWGRLMWQFENIPKRLLCYWGAASPMSYMRYLTFVSFLHHNPDWSITLYIPSTPLQRRVPWQSGEKTQNYDGQDWFWRVFSLSGLSVKVLKFCGDHLNSEVHRSDFVRYTRLHKDGGVWTDLDILFLRPMSELLPTKDLLANIQAAVCWRPSLTGKCHHHIGFLMGALGSAFWRMIAERCKELIKEGVSGYQEIGRKLLDDEAPWDEILLEKWGVGNLDKAIVYPVLPRALSSVYNKLDEEGTDITNSIGLHWYAGHNRSLSAQCQGVQFGSVFAQAVEGMGLEI